MRISDWSSDVCSSDLAKDGGSLIPTLLFSVPTSGSMAVLLGGLTILGIEAGPRMVTSELPVTISIVWSLALANVLGTFVCFLMARPALATYAIQRTAALQHAIEDRQSTRLNSSH